MFFRTLLFGLGGLILGAITFIVCAQLSGESPWEGIYIPCAAGFVAGALGNFINEYFGLYKINLLRRLFKK